MQQIWSPLLPKQRFPTVPPTSKVGPAAEGTMGGAPHELGQERVTRLISTSWGSRDPSVARKRVWGPSSCFPRGNPTQHHRRALLLQFVVEAIQPVDRTRGLAPCHVLGSSDGASPHSVGRHSKFRTGDGSRVMSRAVPSVWICFLPPRMPIPIFTLVGAPTRSAPPPWATPLRVILCVPCSIPVSASPRTRRPARMRRRY